MADAVAEEYKSSLADLNFNSKPLINMLTMLAEDNIKYAPQIVQTIADHIKTVPAEVKLPGLYLVDSIIKNVGKQYLTLFSQNLVTLFSCVFEKVEENTRSLLYKLRQTWNDVLPNKILYAVDVKIKKLDPAWPVTAQSPAQSIHINPKFLGSNAQNSTDASAAKKEEELLKAKQVAVVKQLVIKQEQLRLLEQKTKEIAAGKLLLAKTTAKASSIDPRALAKANPKLSHRDPRLQKINPVPIAKCVDTTTFVKSSKSPYSTCTVPLASVNTLSTAASTPLAAISAPLVSVCVPPIAVNDPSAALVPNVKTSSAVVELQTSMKNSNSEKNVLLSKESGKDIKSTSKPAIASPKKSNSKKADGYLQGLKNSPSDKSKNLSSKNHASPAKDQDPRSDSKGHERKFDVSQEIERSPRHTRSSKETEKSPRSPKKKPSSPEEKSKISTRSTRNQSKLETLRKLPFRQRSRSPIHKTEKSKADILDKEKHGKRFRSGDKEAENSEDSTEANVRVQKGRARGKRESNLSNDEDSKENETAPPEKKIREDDSDDNSDRSREAHALFGKEDQDYRQLSSGHKENDHHKGWAQYKESHPDEFKSPLRSSRDNGNIKTRPFQNVSSDENYFPPEYDRLGRRRLHRGRPDQRFFARRGFFRGPGNRFDAPFPPMEPPFNDSLASMMLTDPNIILQQAEAKFRLGRIAENEYLELRRDLENMLQSEEYRRLRDQTFRMQCPERFHMGESQGFGNQHSGMVKMGSVPLHKGEPIKIQGPHLPPPAVCTFKLDNKMRTIHFVDEKAFVIMDNDEPRELTFKGESHQIFIESLPEPITLGFNGQSAEFEINGGKLHTIRFGAPSRELYIDNYPYEVKFGGGPIAAMLEENRIFKIRIAGNPPQVVLGDKPSFDLFSRLRAAQATGAQPLKPPPAPPMEHTEGQRMPQGGNLPLDVDMRMSVDKSGDGFDSSSREDMKDVDWRHLTPSKPSDESKYFKPIQPPPEPWDQSGPTPVNRNYPDRKPQLDHQEWKNNAPFPSDRPPLLTHEWETLPPPPFPKLNGSPRNTPPNDKEWDHQHPHEADRQDWRENDYRQDVSSLPPHHQQSDQRHHRFDHQRNSSHHIKEEPSQYHDGPRDNMRPRMPHSIRPRFEGKPPQYGTWQRPTFRERGPAPRPTSNLMPPPLPPFQMRPPLLGDEPKRPLLPLPSYPPLKPPLVETVHEKVLRATTVPVTKDSSGVLSSDVAESAEDKSEPSAVPASPINIDVGTLFQKLVAAGIINSKGVNESNEEKKPKVESEANTNKKEKENNPDEEPLPKIPLRLESLRKHHPAVIKALYRGSQCASCGMRFKEIQSDHYSRHLDWHFRMNRREKDGVKKAFSRRWYYEVEDWNQFEEFEDFEERAPSYFELQADGTQVQTDEPVDVPSVPASGQETEVCVVCDEPFQLFWVEEEEEWHLRDAVRHEEQAYHPACYEDHKKASEIPETPVEETVPLLKSEPLEEITKDETTAETDAVPEEVTVKKEEDNSEPTTTEDAKATEETMATAVDLSELKIKEEPDDDILEGKPGEEEEIIGLISESEEMEVDTSEEPKVEPKMVVQSGGGIVLKIKAESMQPMSPATPPSSGVEKEAGSETAAQDSEGEEFRPPTPDPRFQVLPPVQKGTELSGLCSIM